MMTDVSWCYSAGRYRCHFDCCCHPGKPVSGSSRRVVRLEIRLWQNEVIEFQNCIEHVFE